MLKRLTRNNIVRELLIFLTFGCFTSLVTWPYVTRLRDAVVDPGDPYLISWILWWDYHQTFTDPLHLFHANLFYPLRYTLAFSEHSYGIALLFFPLFAMGARPLTVKVVAGITGFRGSKKKGLAMIERVATEGNWARDDAHTLLIVLYTREKRYADALANARELTTKYPRNYLFRLEAADALVSQAEVERKNKNTEAAIKAEREAFATFDDLLHDRSVRDTVSRALDLVHFKYGEVLLTAGEGERAAKEFLAATKVEHAEPTLVTMAHLFAARAFDLAGKREDALAQYREVLTRPDIYAAHEEAKKGLREPFKAEIASSGL